MSRSGTRVAVAIVTGLGLIGLLAVQILRANGCRVVGIAGGPDKCAWLTETAGFDAAVDYNLKKLDDSPRRFPTFWGPGHDWVFVRDISRAAIDLGNGDGGRTGQWPRE